MNEENSEMVEKCVEMLLNNRYMDIAISQDDNPWVSAVYYAVDPELNFYFVSLKTSRHGKYIQENSEVALSIYNSTNPPEEADGIQIDAKAKILEDENLEDSVRTLFSKRFEDEEKQKEYFENYDEKYAGESEKKIFKVESENIYKVSGAYTRSEVPQEPVKKQLKEIEERKGLGEEHNSRHN
ncbi:MAG: pyridoxamine 5'-phosphate oxidase family protein [Candidatus Nanohaloarchaea archaeon]